MSDVFATSDRGCYAGSQDDQTGCKVASESQKFTEVWCYSANPLGFQEVILYELFSCLFVGTVTFVRGVRKQLIVMCFMFLIVINYHICQTPRQLFDQKRPSALC